MRAADDAAKPGVLLVEDDAVMAAMVKEYLEQAEFAVDLVASAAAARKALDRKRHRLAIVDLGLPGEDGLTLIRFLREQGGIGILILTGRSDSTDRVVGLELGADDYMVKPVQLRELLARSRSILRRIGAVQPQPGGRLHFGRWRADLAQHRLTDESGAEIELTAAEFRLLAALLTQPQQVLSRNQLLDVTHGRAVGPYDRSIDVLVGRVRRKLGDDPDQPTLIRTIHGRGYMLTAEVRSED